MVYATIFASLGWYVFIDAMPKGNKWLGLIGLLAYITGMICGDIIERRLNNRVEKLEKESRKEV